MRKQKMNVRKFIGIALVVLGLVVVSVTFRGATAYCVDCQFDKFNDFLAADDNYSAAFQSWYNDNPESCEQECTRHCNEITNPLARQQCLNNLPNCMASCRGSRYDSYQTAADNLSSVGATTCPANLDYCYAALQHRNDCSANYQAQIMNPMYDSDGNVDQVWQSYVDNENTQCNTFALNELEENHCQ